MHCIIVWQQLAVVVAIPLELKGRNVYMSWNFETNFYYPYFDNVQGLVPLPFSTVCITHLANSSTLTTNQLQIVEQDTNLGTFIVQADQQRQLNDQYHEQVANQTASVESDSNAAKDKTTSRKTRQILDYLMTRKRFYKIVESKLKGYDLDYDAQQFIEIMCLYLAWDWTEESVCWNRYVKQLHIQWILTMGS